MKVNISILILILSISILAPILAVQVDSTLDVQQKLFAEGWVESFRKLDARRDIQMVLSLDENLVEIDNVIKLEAFTRFLIVETKKSNGAISRTLVYPGTILLIRETKLN